MTTDVHELLEPRRVSSGAVMFTVCVLVALVAALAQPFLSSVRPPVVTLIQ